MVMANERPPESDGERCWSCNQPAEHAVWVCRKCSAAPLRVYVDPIDPRDIHNDVREFIGLRAYVDANGDAGYECQDRAGNWIPVQVSRTHDPDSPVSEINPRFTESFIATRG